MRRGKRKKGIKKDGTPKKVTVPNRRGVSWASMLEPHYEPIRQARLRRETYKKIASDLGFVASTVLSFVKSRSDGIRPYTLPPRTGIESSAIHPVVVKKVGATAPGSLPTLHAIIPPDNYVSPVYTSPAAPKAKPKAKKGKYFNFPPGNKLTL